MRRVPGDQLKRALFALAIVLVITRALPTLADSNPPTPDAASEVTQAPVDPSQTPAPVDSPSQSPTPTPDPLVSALPEPSATPSASPTSIPGATIIVHVPSVLKVDPRAQIVSVSPLLLTSSHPLLVCMTSYRTGIEISSLPEGLLANQPTRSTLLLSGQSALVHHAISGMHLVGSLGNSALAMQFVAVTAPTLNSALCADANTVTQTSVSTLGLEQGLVKVPLNMAKKQ